MYTITEDTINKDSSLSKGQYLSLYDGFESKLDGPDFYATEERSDLFVLDFANGPCGLKAYGAEKLIATMSTDVMGYAAPRVGHAAEAIAMLSELYGKRAVFFAAASKEVSAHQAVVMGYGADLRFARIPAMPTLNLWIRNWADKYSATALPFGLANTPLVTAGLITVATKHAKEYEEPVEFYCAVSTGTMIRALQIAWPNATPVGVAVARNIKPGEIGRAQVTSYHKTFYKTSDYLPNFNTTTNYDAKAYKLFIDNGKPGSIFINVGSDEQISKRLTTMPNWQATPSNKIWGDLGAFSYA